MVPCFAVESFPTLALEKLAEHGATRPGQPSRSGGTGGHPDIIIARPTILGGEVVNADR